MSTMPQPIQAEDGRISVSDPQPIISGDSFAGLRRLKTPLRIFAGLLVVPVLLIAAILSFVVVLADFAFFRLRDRRNGHPEPKGLWEF